MGRQKDGVLFPTAPPLAQTKLESERYGALISALKEDVRRTQLRSVSKANAELIRLYWRIGKRILDMQEEEGWGAKVIDRISRDLRNAFPDAKGFSAYNLKMMRRFAATWPEDVIVEQLVPQLPWGTNIVLLKRLDSVEARLWYAQQALEQGWSRSVLEMQIDSHLMERSGKALNNFAEVLPPADSDMAAQVFKDPYLFDFLGIDASRRELEVERRLTEHIQDFLLELGRGFAFVGRQVPLEVGDTTFYLDMLFYHLELRCYVVIELKASKFDPAYLGQLNLYRNAVDDLLRHEGDGRTIGLLLVKGKDDVVVKYALGGIDGPMGVSDWQERLQDEMGGLPEELEGSLPTIEEIERELEGTGDADA